MVTDTSALSERSASFDSRLQRPVLLTVTMLVSAFLAIGFAFAAVSLLGGQRSYSVDGRHVSREEFLVRTGVLIYSLPFLAAYLAALAYALRTNRAWSRPLALAYLPLSLLLCIPMLLQALARPRLADVVGLPVFAFACALLARWYLYRRPRVVAYYAEIAKKL
jgi:hypothetical protein